MYKRKLACPLKKEKRSKERNNNFGKASKKESQQERKKVRSARKTQATWRKKESKQRMKKRNKEKKKERRKERKQAIKIFTCRCIQSAKGRSPSALNKVKNDVVASASQKSCGLMPSCQASRNSHFTKKYCKICYSNGNNSQ